MTKQNLPDVPNKKFSWPVWFPYPSSWLKALIILLLLGVIIFAIEIIGKVEYRIVYFVRSPEIFAIITILIVLSPILIIAFTHHFLHIFISRFFPEIQSKEIGRTQGLLPGIISWWEGLYGWLVIVMSTLLSFLACTFFLPFFRLSYRVSVINYTDFQQKIILLFGFFWLFAGSLIYQIEFLFKRRLIAAHTIVQQPEKKPEAIDSNHHVEQELKQLKTALHQKSAKSNIQPVTPQKTVSSIQKTYSSYNKKLLLLLLIPLAAVGIYLYSQFTQIQNNQPLPVAATPQAEASIIPTVLPTSDNFREAVNQAISTAKLTQSAKTQAEWQTVVTGWKIAIELMKTVPSSSSNYAVAQQKISEYQRNLDYAQKNALDVK
jgi:hypothetical protein